MSDQLDAVMRTTVEEPASIRLLALVQRGQLREADIQQFNAAVTRFKRAILANYESFDPVVRDELRATLLRDYRRTIDEFVEAMVRRDPAVVDAEITPTSENREIVFVPVRRVHGRHLVSVVSAVTRWLRRGRGGEPGKG